MLEEAVRFRFRPRMVYYSDSSLSERGHALLERFRQSGVDLQAVPERQMRAVSETETPQGILALFPLPSHNLAELHKPSVRKVVICDDVADPGNLGTLIRSALAFDFDMVIVTGSTVEPFAPKVIRASAGAVFGLPVGISGLGDIVRWARENEFVLVAADPHGGVTAESLRQTVRRKKLALAIGSEPRGLSPELIAAATERIRISHSNSVESLNAAVAGSILMHEIYDLNIQSSR